MRGLILMGAALALSACAGGGLGDLRTNSGGPDEFSVVPGAPLEFPDTLTLPTPTPGGENRADISPNSNAVIALGGSPAVAFAGGNPAIVANATLDAFRAAGVQTPTALPR